MVKCDECGDETMSYYEDGERMLCFACYHNIHTFTDNKEPKQIQEIVSDVIKKKVQMSFEELKKAGLVGLLKIGDYLGILKELEKDEILVALTKSEKPMNAKVFITNKRIMMREYLELGTEFGVDFDFSYSDIDKNSIMIRGILKSVHFNAKGDKIVIYNTQPRNKIQDVIKELVEKEGKEKMSELK